MSIDKLDVFGSPNIGVYCFCSQTAAIVPTGTTRKKMAKIEQLLGVATCVTDLGGSKLLGVLAAANSNRLIVPHLAQDFEIRALEASLDLPILVLQEKQTALGNLILTNDHGAIIDPDLSERAETKISKALDVPVVRGTIAGLPYVGALALATNQGVLTHPEITREEKKVIEEALRVPVETGTVNGGVPFIHSGILANTRGALVGNLTTGAEAMAITQILNL